MAWRRTLVASFVAFHAASIVLLSLPRPPAEVLRGEPSEEVDAFVASARDRLGPGVEDPIRAAVGAWAALSRAWSIPFAPYARVAGTQQGWTMFGRVPTRSERLEIWVRRAGDWEPLYVAGSDAATWRRAFFENERLRTFVHASVTGKRARWDEFADWVAREVRAEAPGVRQVKVQLVGLEIPPPAELARTGALRVGKPFRVELRPPGRPR